MEHIRPASLEDAEAILNIYAPYITDTAVSFETEVPSVSAFRERIREILETYPYLVAEREGEIVGYAYAHRMLERAAYGWNVELSIYLAPDAKGRGTGTRLYAALLELLRMQRLQNCYAGVTRPNPASEALHSRFGFTLCATWHDTGFKQGKWHDVLWFEKSIGAHTVPPESVIPFGLLDGQAVRQVLERTEQGWSGNSGSEPC